MLIGAIFALLVLVIILGSINYFEQLGQDVSNSRFFTGLQNAVRQPTGRVLVVENIQFETDTQYTSSSIGRSMGLDSECVEFAPSDSSSIEINLTSVKIKQAAVTDVFILCNNKKNPESTCASSSCEICCKLSFGTALEDESESG